MQPTPQCPNLLFVVADRYRYDYLGCAGAGFVCTPNLGRLAGRGVRFAQCVTESAWSSTGLKAGGQFENTYIIFSSDHGEVIGDHGLYTKSVAYEASARVPLIVAGRRLPGGRACDALVQLMDLKPTLCQLAGIPAQEYNTAAQSIAPLLLDDRSEHRTDLVSVIRNWRCLRTHDHKLIQNENDVTELYDLERDPEERDNVVPARPELVRALSSRLRERLLEGHWHR